LAKVGINFTFAFLVNWYNMFTKIQELKLISGEGVFNRADDWQEPGDDFRVPLDYSESPSEDIAVLLVHGSYHTSRTFEPLKQIIEGKGYEVIAPDLPAGKLSATNLTDAHLLNKAIAGKKVLAVGHSRGYESVERLAEILDDNHELDRLIGAVALSSGGSHGINLRHEKDRYQPRFKQGIRKLKNEPGFSVFDPEISREVLYPDVEPELAEMAVGDLRKQRDVHPDDKKAAHILPANVPLYWISGDQDGVHNQQRVKLVTEYIKRQRVADNLKNNKILGPNMEVIPINSGHTPQLAVPGLLSTLMINIMHDANLRHYGHKQ
jgi:pimeloyl-ACP methyl ester carboxylesterase